MVSERIFVVLYHRRKLLYEINIPDLDSLHVKPQMICQGFGGVVLAEGTFDIRVKYGQVGVYLAGHRHDQG